MALTAKQQIFITEYLRTWNATAAAITAGYSEKTARAIGAENLTKPDIAAAIAAELDRRKMGADEALARTAAIARFDITEWIDEDGQLDIDGIRAAGLGHCLRKVKTTQRQRVSGDVVTTVEVEAYPADAAHDKLLRHHGQYNDKLAVDLALGSVTKIEIVRGDD